MTTAVIGRSLKPKKQVSKKVCQANFVSNVALFSLNPIASLFLFVETQEGIDGVITSAIHISSRDKYYEVISFFIHRH